MTLGRTRPLLLALSLSLVSLTPAVALAPESTSPTLVARWNEVLLDCIRQARLGPPVTARAIGVVYTSGYDAWAMYDDAAVGTRLGGALRRPPAERTEANREKAFSYAVYRSLLDLFPAQAAMVTDAMIEFGFDPDDASSDPGQAAGIGNVCAQAVIDFRHHDGSNQLGDLHAGPYSDYTGYVPVNDVDHIVDPNRWQPLRFSDGKGGTVIPPFVAPHWGQVTAFALTTSSQLRPGPPERWPNGKYVAQAEEILRLNARLDDRRKSIAEYWADGPGTDQPPGHWLRFAQYVSMRDGHAFDDDVKLFFLVGNALLDAGIATWEAKRFYDSERPITAIHFLKAGKKVLAYVPFQGPRVIRGEDWLPYQTATFVTPPFAEYTSGHSAFSAAAAEILERFTGSGFFGGSFTFLAGTSKVEPGFSPTRDVTLSWATFQEAADQAGLSRRYGGIHFEEGDLRGRALGREVAALVWDKGQSLIHGGSFVALGRPGVEPAALSPAGRAIEAPVLAGIAPNPSAGAVRFQISLPSEASVRLSVLDVRGREIAVVGEGTYGPGSYEMVWDGRARGRLAGAGVYFARFTAGAASATRSFVRF